MVLVLVVSSIGLGQWREVVLELGVCCLSGIWARTTSGAGAGRVLSGAVTRSDAGAGAATSSCAGAGRVLSGVAVVTTSGAGAGRVLSGGLEQ